MEEQLMVWIGLSAIGILTLIIILVSSFSSIGVGQIGLDYSSMFKSIDKATYGSGFYYIGLTHSFLKFPGVVQNIEFSNEAKANMGPIKSRTLDGLEVQLEISFQYRLMFERLHDMYMKYGKNYEKIFIYSAVDVLTDMTTKFTAYKFFYDRQLIGDSMRSQLALTFNTTCFAVVESLQLRTVDLPNEFEASIQETEVKKQDIEKAKAEEVKTQVECETRVKEAQFQMNVTINRAMGEVMTIQQNNLAEVQNTLVTQRQQTEAYYQLKAHLGLTNEQLLSYVKAKVIKDYPSSSNMIISLSKLND